MCRFRILVSSVTLWFARACRIQADEEHEMDVFAIVFEIISVSTSHAFLNFSATFFGLVTKALCA